MQPDIPALLLAFARQRPGLDFANYGDVASYRAEARSITRDLHDAVTLVNAASCIPEETWRGAFRAFSGRLTLTERPDGTRALDYCTGQYWPTEYRRAVCAVAAAALWDSLREGYAAQARKGESAGDAIRRRFRERFGSRLARRWFN